MARVPGNVVETNRIYVFCVFLSTTPPLFYAIMYLNSLMWLPFQDLDCKNLWYSC